MHPLIAGKGRLSLYLLAWIPLAFLVAYLLVMTAGLAWLEAAALSLPLTLLYALIFLAPGDMCRALPLGLPSMLKILEYHSAAAAVAALTWIVAAKSLALAMIRYAFADLNQRFS